MQYSTVLLLLKFGVFASFQGENKTKFTKKDTQITLLCMTWQNRH